jgi:hypothetical protein
MWVEAALATAHCPFIDARKRPRWLQRIAPLPMRGALREFAIEADADPIGGRSNWQRL